MMYLLYIVAALSLFSLGVVAQGCSEEGKVKCVNDVQAVIESIESVYDKCRQADSLFKCLIDLGCSATIAGKDRADIIEKYNCEGKNKPDEKFNEQQCIIHQVECEQHILDTTLRKKDVICANLKEYERCMGSYCTTTVINSKMADYMKEVRVDDCPAIQEDLCENIPAMEKCEIAYISAYQELGLSGTDEECGVAKGLVRCLKSKGSCTLGSVKRTMKRVVKNPACFEMLDECNTRKDQCVTNVIIDIPNPTCEDMKKMKDCLHKEADCNEDHVRLLLRNVFKSKKLDCPDIGVCNANAEESCSVTLSEEITKPDIKEKCPLFEKYAKCMKNAQCNRQYLVHVLGETMAKFPDAKCNIDIDTLDPSVIPDKCQKQLDNCDASINWDDSSTLPHVGDQKVACENVKKYSSCLGVECDQNIKRKRMAAYLKKMQVLDCPDVPEAMCENSAKVEGCTSTFMGAMADLKLEDDAVCPLITGLARCLRNESQCRPGTVRRIVERLFVQNDQCSEMDLCGMEEEEICLLNAIGNPSCQASKEMQSCLEKKSNCNPEHVRFATRKYFDTTKLECADVNACNMFTELACSLKFDDMKDGGDRCGAYKDFENCMNGAQCNQAYLKAELEKENTDLGNPCGSCSLAASLGLVTLLMVASLFKSI